METKRFKSRINIRSGQIRSDQIRSEISPFASLESAINLSVAWTVTWDWTRHSTLAVAQNSERVPQSSSFLLLENFMHVECRPLMPSWCRKIWGKPNFPTKTSWWNPYVQTELIMQHSSNKGGNTCTTPLYYTILYNTIQYYTILYNTIQYYTILYNTIQYNTIQYNTIQYYTIQYNIMRGVRVESICN
jgi:hypothetical protein